MINVSATSINITTYNPSLKEERLRRKTIRLIAETKAVIAPKLSIKRII